jgi:hypothetical protein
VLYVVCEKDMYFHHAGDQRIASIVIRARAK